MYSLSPVRKHRGCLSFFEELICRYPARCGQISVLNCFASLDGGVPEARPRMKDLNVATIRWQRHTLYMAGFPTQSLFQEDFRCRTILSLPLRLWLSRCSFSLENWHCLADTHIKHAYKRESTSWPINPHPCLWIEDWFWTEICHIYLQSQICSSVDTL